MVKKTLSFLGLILATLMLVAPSASFAKEKKGAEKVPPRGIPSRINGGSL